MPPVLMLPHCCGRLAIGIAGPGPLIAQEIVLLAALLFTFICCSSDFSPARLSLRAVSAPSAASERALLSPISNLLISSCLSVFICLMVPVASASAACAASSCCVRSAMGPARRDAAICCFSDSM
eukprot:GHUV01028260.1.p1 GENE.GHUV01028260.1~~GHUV01028260.1.p1  ORF type:complete len:125 (-),score=15.18 GHUV01028260.1:389-763(-)